MMIFTDYELAEWPALALLIGPHQPLPLRPDQLVMRVNVNDHDAGTGLIASGYAYHTLAEAILLGLVAKYKLPGHQRWLSLDAAIEAARFNLDGRDVEPWLASFLRHNAESALKQVEDYLLPEGLLLCLGSEYHDLDLEIDEDWVYEQELALARVARRVITPVVKPVKLDPRWTAERVGDVITPKDVDKPQTSAIAVITLAVENGWSPGGQLGLNLRKVGKVVDATEGVPTAKADLITVYGVLPAALDYLNGYVAPEGHRFEYAYGYLVLGRVPIPYPEPGVVIDSDGFASVYSLALEVLDLARNLGRKTDGKWRRRLWRSEYDPVEDWGPGRESILDGADLALDWLNDEYAQPGHIFEIDDAGLILRTRETS